MLRFEVEAMTSESSIEHGLLNEIEANLLEVAASVFITLLPKPLNQYTTPEEVIGFPEGATSQVLVNKYERDPRNRAAAIAVHGYTCLACGFDFHANYGGLGNDFIVVHHVVPVSLLGANYIIDPSKDLITLCANCHAMIHRQDSPLSLDQLISILRAMKK
jgi:5-methylcytosine-specific restriction protein A